MGIKKEVMFIGGNLLSGTGVIFSLGEVKEWLTVFVLATAFVVNVINIFKKK